MDEWSYYPGNWGEGQSKEINSIGDPKVVDGVAQEVQGAAGAAFDASVLTLLQDSTVNIANFYHGTTVVLWGMFNPHGVPNKTYYTFEAFKSLLETPERVATVTSDLSGVTAIARTFS